MGVRDPRLLYMIDENHVITTTTDPIAWSDSFGDWEQREKLCQVARDVLPGIEFSTIFMGIDYAWGRFDVPILFETMAFRPGRVDLLERYATWDEARTGHTHHLADYLERNFFND